MATTMRETLTDPGLWRRIAAFEIDDRPAERGFAERLAADCGWNLATAEAAIGEYRRFVYLQMVAGEPLTPSVAVDIVWHLHLCYSRSHWDRFCPEVLGRPLHHDPTPGGAQAEAAFRRQYERALALYEAEFGHAPPRLFWPGPGQRFNPAARPRLYAPATHVLLRHRWLGAGVLLLSGLALLQATVGRVELAALGTVLTAAGLLVGAGSLLGMAVSRARRAVGLGGAPAAVGLSVGVSEGGSDGDGDRGCGGD